MFSLLERNFPEQSARYYLFVEELLFEHQEYAIIAKYLGNPLRKFEMLRHVRELSLTSAAGDSPRALETYDQIYVDGVVRLLEVLVAIDRRDEALEVQKRAMEYYPHDSIMTAIQ